MSLKIVDVNKTSTYAPVGTELATASESNYSGALVVVFNAANQLEKAETMTAADITAGQTKKFAITTGTKRVYVLLNIPAAATISTTAGMSRTAWEKEIHTLTMAQVSTANSFFMTNVVAPAGFPLVAGVVDPVLESKNVVTVNVGRVVAKVNVDFNATAANQIGGKLSSIKYKVKGIETQMYTIGQIVGGINETPHFAGPYVATNYVDAATFENVADYYNNVNTGLGQSPVTYPLENTNTGANILQGNTTRVVIQAVFTPDVWLDATGAVSTGSTGDQVWAVWDIGGVFLGYANATPTAAWTAAIGGTIKTYPNGICYYNKVWIMDSAETGTMKYATVRNYAYKVNITSVNGIGTEGEDDDIIPIDPIETNTQMQVEIAILPWSVVNVVTGLEGV